MAQDQENAPTKWMDLHSNLLWCIYKRLYDTFDFFCFRAVCKSWREAASLSDHPPQLPFLISDDFKVYSLHTGETRNLHVPEDQNKMFFGQSNGYLITYGCWTFPDPLEPFTTTPPVLFNPFTRVQLKLQLKDFSFYSPIFIGMNAIPNSGDDMVIQMRSVAKGNCLGFWNKQDNKWRGGKFFLGDAKAFHKKRLFHYTPRHTTVVDLMTGNDLLDIEHPHDERDFYCLVEAAGTLLGIVLNLHIRTDGIRLEEHSFVVYRLEEEKEPPCWVKLDNIGDQMIFVNRNSGFCLNARSFDGIRGNCIYFTTWNGMRGPHCMTFIGRYDLEKKRSLMVGHSMQLSGNWIVPNVY